VAEPKGVEGAATGDRFESRPEGGWEGSGFVLATHTFRRENRALGGPEAIFDF